MAVQALPPDSGIRISTSIIYGMNATNGGYSLGRLERVSGDYVVNITSRDVLHSSRQIYVFPSDPNAPFTTALNTALSGGESYPVMNFVLSTAAGFVSAGAGLLFSVLTTAVDLSRRTSKIQVRPGDELWRIEQVGYEGTALKIAIYYFLVDPYRGQSPTKGWLIGEIRQPARFPERY